MAVPRPWLTGEKTWKEPAVDGHSRLTRYDTAEGSSAWRTE